MIGVNLHARIYELAANWGEGSSHSITRCWTTILPEDPTIPTWKKTFKTSSVWHWADGFLESASQANTESKQFQTRRGTCNKMSRSSVYYILLTLYLSMHVCENHNKALSCIRPTLERRPPLKWVDSEYSGILQGGDYRPEHFKRTERSGCRTFTIKHSWNDFVFEHLRGVLIYGIYLFMVVSS